MQNVILLRYGEIHLKGNNRGFFEKLLIDNIKKSVSEFNCDFINIGGRYLLKNYNPQDENKIIEKVQKVFGLVSLSKAYELTTSEDEIKKCATQYFKTNYNTNENFSFRVTTKRADKNFAIHSDKFSADIGEIILNTFLNCKVELKEPNTTLFVDIRENGKTYIYGDKIKCNGGMPVGSSGKGLLMLSGGIDSPVAGYEIAKRGMRINAIHFYSYPYTSLKAKEKVLTLAKQLTDYAGKIRIFFVPFTKIQEAIHMNCDDSYMINIMRRIMLRIADRVALENGCQAIITGESLGQVASQTIESITTTNAVVKNVPILRPLITNDKEETILVSKKIGVFETSILPYEDCCTVFLPKNPIIKPRIKNVEKQEKYLDIEKLIEEAMINIEIIDL